MTMRRVQIVSVDCQDLRVIVAPHAEALELVIRHVGARSAPAKAPAVPASPVENIDPFFYRAEGPLDEFLNYCCQVADSTWVRSVDLSTCYGWWCKRKQRPRLGRAAFLYRVKALGFEFSRSRREGLTQLRTIEGLRIKPEILSVMLGERSEPEGAAA